jgi:putative two-component system response regulator
VNILIVDDDDLSLDLLANALQCEGYTVSRAANGREALEFLRHGSCQLVISDWEMPEMSGIDLCRAVRNEDLGRYIYIILLTSHASKKELVAGMSAGADDFISKPFDPAELAVRVRAGGRVVALETRDMAIFALAKLAESRDSETGHHLERVQSYSRVLAMQLARSPQLKGQIDAEYIRLIYLTSPLHDIGKVGIPDGILLKPGKLTPVEFEIMKRHTILGAETLAAALKRFPEARFLQIARDIAATHHERWDGTGYPVGLSGQSIPLAGRIVALADVYDALTSKRAYKEAFAHATARSIIVAASGSHFDPAVVDAFVNVENQFIAIRTRLNETGEISNRLDFPPHLGGWLAGTDCLPATPSG